MRYWVYINDKVEGPFEEDKLVTLEGFTPDTLICSETTEAGANQEWVKASAMFEFDPLESTITRALPTPEELNTAVNPGTTDPNLTQALKEAHFASQSPAQEAAPVSTDATQLILEKLDSLTREIENLKQKMEEVITASSHAQALSLNTQHAANTQPEPAPEVDMAANTITLTNRDMSHTASTIEDSTANTDSLVTQAESLVAQANQPENKNADFLHGIDLSSEDSSANPAELPLGGKGEEEVVLRSALDSLYGAKVQEEQTEKEKESTFQDLLRPHNAVQNAQNAEKTKPTLEDALKETQNAGDTEQQKEEVLQQFAPTEQKDFIAEALAEAEKENQAKQSEQASSAVKEEQPAAQPLEGLTPVTPEQEAAIKQDLPQPENEVPVLSISGSKEEDSASKPEQEEAPAAMADLPQMPQSEAQPEEASRDMGEEVPLKTVSSMLPGLASLGGEEPAAEPAPAPQQEEQATPQAAQEEQTETIQELVPGATLDKTVPPVTVAKEKKEDKNENADLLSADDLKNTEAAPFTAEEEALMESPVPRAAQEPAVSQPQPSQPAQEEPQGLASLEPVVEQPAEQQAPAPATQTVEEQLDAAAPANELEKTTTQAEYTPNDLTEIELKEGSTYLISDFVPPAQAADFAAAAQAAMAKTQAELKGENKTEQKSEELAVEEVVPANNNNQAAQAQAAPAPESPLPGADVTVSQIILENTIKTKRGAALDIKTVPMVKDPAESQRLDLSDTELQDVTMQHDLKAADLPSSPKKAKTLVMAVMLLVLIGAIYAGVAYLQLIPDNINFINPKPAVSDQTQDQLNEMLPADPVQPAAAQVSPTDRVLAEVKNYALPNGMTLEQLIVSRHPNAANMIEWTISSAVDPDNYSVMAKVPPENPQSFKISYRFNYNTVTRALEPTISDSKNLLMSVGVGSAQQAPAANVQQPAQQQAMQMTAAQQQALRQQQLAMQQAQQRASAQAVPPAPRQAAVAQRPVR